MSVLNGMICPLCKSELIPLRIHIYLCSDSRCTFVGVPIVGGYKGVNRLLSKEEGRGLLSSVRIAVQWQYEGWGEIIYGEPERYIF